MTVLIRHGQSSSNAGFRSEHPAEPPLTDKGWVQAHALVPEVPRTNLLVVSPFVRSQQTASVLAEAWGVVPETWDVQEWTCLEATRIVGSDHEERAVLVREYLRRWNPKHVEGPNAESFEQFMARVDTFLLRVSALEHAATVVSHAWFMKAVLWRGGHSGKIDANAMKSYCAFAEGFEIRNCQWFRLL